MTMSHGRTAQDPSKERLLPSMLHTFSHLLTPSFCFYILRETSPQLNTWEAGCKPTNTTGGGEALTLHLHGHPPDPWHSPTQIAKGPSSSCPAAGTSSLPLLRILDDPTRTKAPDLGSGGSTHPTPRSPAWLEKTWLETPCGLGESQGSAKEALEMKSIQEKVRGETET